MISRWTWNYRLKDTDAVGRADDDLAIRALFDRWYRAIEEGNVARLLSLVTADVMIKAPGSAPILGACALEQALTAFLGELSETVDYEVTEVEVSGEIAFALISESAKMLPGSASKASSVSGMHLAILRRQPDGEWLLARDVSSLVDPA